MMTEQVATKNKNMAWFLSLLGLAPFIVIALALIFLDPKNAATTPIFSIFRTYSALMLTFLGGIRWGNIIHEENENKETKALAFSVLPALTAWLTLLAPPQHASIALLILLLAFCAHGAWDSLAGNNDKLPKWYSALRIKMTLIVAACHIVVFYAIAN